MTWVSRGELEKFDREYITHPAGGLVICRLSH